MIIKGSKDNYERLELIGQGNTGKVYQGRALSSNKIVAIKQLAANLVENEMALQRYRQEAVLLSILDHPNIVKLIDVSEGKGTFTLVLEYFEGQTLESFLAKFSGDREQLAEKIMGQLLDGLNSAHENGIFHRDIKPGNILINDKKEIKIIDFGIAKMIDSDENLAKTIIDSNIGTPRYMSPEQVKGLNLDHRTDLYSSGVLLHEILSGKVPYGDVKTMFEMQRKIIDDTLPHVNTSNAKWNSILEKALQVDRRNRYSKAVSFRNEVLGNTSEVTPLLFKLNRDKSNNLHVVVLEGENQVYQEINVKPGELYPIETDIDFRTDDDREVIVDPPRGLPNWILYSIIILIASLGVFLILTLSEKQNLEYQLEEKQLELDFYKSTI